MASGLFLRILKGGLEILPVFIMGVINRFILFYLLPAGWHAALLIPVHRIGGFRGTEVTAEDLRHDIGNIQGFQTLFNNLVAEISMGWVEIGDSVPDFALTRLLPDGGTAPSSLLSHARKGRPLVVNIGSCT